MHPPLGQVDHRAAGRRADRSAPGRLAHPFGAVRHRGRRVCSISLALRLWRSVWWAGLRRAAAGPRRPPHRPEPDGDARHLPHDVRHGGRALPRARPRADGRLRPSWRWRWIARGLRLAVTGCGPASSWDVRSRRSGPARSRCRSWRASARSGCSPEIGGAIARRSRRRDAGGLFAARPAGGLPGQLRRVLLPARVRGPRFLGPAVRDAAVPAGASTPSSRRTRSPWTWPLLLHPVRYLEEMRDGSSSVVMALGNPVLWWGFLLLLPVALVQIVRRAGVAGRGRLRWLRGDVPAVVR